MANQIPKGPTNFYFIRKNGLSLLRWDRVYLDTENQPIVISKYVVSRTTQSNDLGFTPIAEILTLDVDGFRDTFYADVFADDSVFYRVCPYGPSGDIGQCAFAGAGRFSDPEDNPNEPNPFILDQSELDGPDLLS